MRSKRSRRMGVSLFLSALLIIGVALQMRGLSARAEKPLIPTIGPKSANLHDPQGVEIVVKKGQIPNAADGIKDKYRYTEDTRYTFADGTPKTDRLGVQEVRILVTYGDQSTDIVKTTLRVEEADNDKYNPEGQNLTVKRGELVRAIQFIKDTVKYPTNTVYGFKNGEPKTDLDGIKEVTILVTYPDKSTDEVKAMLTVGEKTTPDGAAPAKVNPADSPSTGDRTGIYLIFTIALCAVVFLYTLRKKKHRA